jgi:iron complex outermembrane receptor protein
VKGVELSGGASLLRNLTLFSSFSYNDSTLLDNLYTAANAFVAVKGTQTVDTPPYVFKSGLTFTAFGASLSPVERYISARYGDTGNTQRVSPYAVTDLNLSYALKNLRALRDTKAVKGLTVTLSCLNLFNRRYVAVIGAFEDAQSASYLVGPPRTVVARVGASF